MLAWLMNMNFAARSTSQPATAGSEFLIRIRRRGRR